MKKLFYALLTSLGVALLTITPATFAQTPDGETPANEGVCDDLQGGTPGLYGLCVAFCEAQDHAALSNPITEAELEALQEGLPSGKILANYNKKKQDGDPDMPCIKVEEPCPCWDSEEFDTVVLSSNNVDGCHRWNGTWHNGSFIQHFDLTNFSTTFREVLTLDHQHHIPDGYGRAASCLYRDYTQTPRLNRGLLITPEELTACDAQIRQAMIDTSRTCSDSN